MKEYKINYRNIFNNQTIPLCIVNPSLQILRYNSAFQSFLNLETLEVACKILLSLKSVFSVEANKLIIERCAKLKRDNKAKLVNNNLPLLLEETNFNLVIQYNDKEDIFIIQFLLETVHNNQLVEQVAMYENIIQGIQDAIFCTTLSGEILFTNRAIFKIYGYEAEELISKNIGIISSLNDINSKKIVDSLKFSGRFQGTVKHIKKNGQEFLCSFSLEYIFDPTGHPSGLVASCRDNSHELKAKEYAVASSELENIQIKYEDQIEQLRVYENIIENNWDAIVFADLTGEILFCNPSTSKMYSYEMVDLIGKNIDIFSLQDSDHAQALVRGLKNSGGWSGEVIHQRSDGSQLNVLLTVSMVFNESGHPFALVSTSKNITERIKAQLNEHIKNEELLKIKDKFVEDLERQVKERTKELQKEQAKSENLLLNILPEEIAHELKEKGHATPRHYENVSILFTDFVGFTNISEKLSPQDLITQLGYFFKEFDRISEKYKIEKIKTIGDAYMCVSGLPLLNHNHAIDAIKAALEMQAVVKEAGGLWQDKDGKAIWSLRAGIHSGSVVAGVVGSSKFAFDIWGDAVNIASRMESNSVTGRVNVSETTYQLTKDKFSFEHRGQIEAKNKGAIDMYFVE